MYTHIINIMIANPFQGNIVAICRGYFILDAGQWTEEVSLHASETTQYEGEELWICKVMEDVDNNHRATVAKEIAHINFTALVWLYLVENGIDSIEGLARVQMPHIKTLCLGTCGDSLGCNNITSMGVMRKAAWPAL